MQYRQLGSTGLSVSVVGIGTWQLAGVWDKQFTQSEVNAIFAKAGEMGVNIVDTAECYGDHLSEQLVGNSIANCRDKWVIATKFGHNPGNDLGDENFQPNQVLLQLEDSLRALRTDYIDIYQIHSAKDEFFENDELWTMLDKQVQAGKVRYLGNSVFMPRMEQQASKSQAYGVSVLQLVYNAISTKTERVFSIAKEQSLGVIARTPLACGYLSGKYQPGRIFPATDVRSMWPQEARDRDIKAALEALKEVPEGMNPATWANAWCLRNPHVSTVIPGIKNVEQMVANASAGDISAHDQGPKKSATDEPGKYRTLVSALKRKLQIRS